MTEGPTSTVARLSVGSCTDVGAVRSRNEDSVFVEPLDSSEAAAHGWLGIVADGLGGHRRGDLASQLAVQTTRDVFVESGSASPGDTGERLRLAVERANAVIRRTGEESSATKRRWPAPSPLR